MNASRSIDTVYVSMFGKFKLQKGEHILCPTGGRTKQVWLLIEFLLAHRQLQMPVEKLIEVLWSDCDACADPMNALKNLVYRARALLKTRLQDSSEYIIYSQGSYLWNPELPCVVDVEELERLAKLSSLIDSSKEEKIALYKKIFSYYQGDFLPGCSDMGWAASRKTYFASLYIDCTTKLCTLLAEKQDYKEIISICETAAVFIPLEESIHKTLIQAYIRTGQKSKALTHYRRAAELFYRELGVDIAPQLKRYYQQVMNLANQTEIDLCNISADLKEAQNIKGAYFCDYETFKNLYRIQARMISRTDDSIYVALLSPQDQNGCILQESSTAFVVHLLKNVILSSLRKGDTVAAYGFSQFMIMLPLINRKNAEMVMHRIIRRFEEQQKNQEIKIVYKLSRIESAEK
ncbi:BTAD domain-containing putative transcriptional regulator [Clostridium minihomine]|uniref:BTAD domain-containing putative transcriptional regulator n=1 Tax=Clostridium minihomine TaxID=2045012 RepID=UPI000C78BF94|nr:BTAD domain-containing putative transcriptional regulator [Clostridium minihomine]